MSKINPSDLAVKTRNERGSPVQSVFPRDRQEVLKWSGWGYKDSQFELIDDRLFFSGKRYSICDTELPYFQDWVKEELGIDIRGSKKIDPLPLPKEEDLPQPVIIESFLAELEDLQIPYSLKGLDRLIRCHGHTLQDICLLREGKHRRLPDVVAWPDSHETVVKLVECANRHNVVVIPYGGGTSVSGAVTCPVFEKRCILSLDTSQMNKILWIDTENLMACFEAGIIGQDMERELSERGFTTGHEPDSYEFSSLGGWVATRASGMKKNKYGNIEDLLVHVRMVTPSGVLEKNTQTPRMSCGPDFNHIILGSEGTLGVVTEVTLKICPLPQIKKYGSIVFSDFESGVRCLREVARQRCQPTSIRLMNNSQFRFGQALRQSHSYFGLLLDSLKMAYITKIKGFDPTKMCVATLLFEGDKKDIELQEKKLYDIAGKFGGIPAGEKNGTRGYMLTFVIAYIRDLGLEFDVLSESFETSVNWDRAISLCHNVKHRMDRECQARGIKLWHLSYRVTQTYDVGCCIYFYFAFNGKGMKDPLITYESLESIARDEIIASGGNISHHHGVGKLRTKWYPMQVTDLGVQLYQATKKNLDPNNIFANGNLINTSHL